MPTTPDSRFRLLRHRQSWRIWDGAAVVFEPLSGDTHRIDHPGGRVLALLTESEQSRTAIDSALAPETTTEAVDEALDLLLTLELVEPA